MTIHIEVTNTSLTELTEYLSRGTESAKAAAARATTINVQKMIPGVNRGVGTVRGQRARGQVGLGHTMFTRIEAIRQGMPAIRHHDSLGVSNENM